MRILQVVSYYPPALSFGGPPQVMFDLGKELAARGHPVTAFTTDVVAIDDWKARASRQDDEMDGIKIRRFRRVRGSHRLPTKFLKLLVSGAGVAGELRGFDIIHIADITHPLAVRFASLAGRLGIPYVISVFGNLTPAVSLPRRVLGGAFSRLWGRSMLGGAAALLAQTPHEGAACRRYTSPDRVVTMLLPVDTALFADLPPRGEFRRRYGIGAADKVILFLGRIHKYKGIQLLVQASAGLLGSDSGSRLVIAGSDDGYRQALEGQVSRLGIAGKVIFSGPTFGRDKLAAYRDADVFVTTPLNYEETSLAALEACACGTPAIVTGRNAIPGLTDYQAGFEINSPDELESSLHKILADSALRDSMGENARRLIAREYDLGVVSRRLEGLFLDIIQKGAA